MAARIWEVAALVQEKRDVSGNLLDPAELVVEPTYVIAGSEQKALVELAKLVPDEVKEDAAVYDRLELAVRPF